MKNNYITQDEFFELVGKVMETHEHGKTNIDNFKQEYDEILAQMMSTIELLLNRVNAMEEVIDMMTKYINDNMQKG